jgi:hypothetical protein
MNRRPAHRSSALRIDSPEVAIRDTVRERWMAVILVLGNIVMSARSIARVTSQNVVTGLNALEIGLTALCALLVTAGAIGARLGAPMVGLRGSGRRGTVVLDGGLAIDMDGRTRRFSRDEVVSGWMEHFADGDIDVVLQMRRAIVRWRASDEAEARAALDAAGVAPDRRAVSLRLGVAQGGDGRGGVILLALFVSIIGAVAGAGGVFVAISSAPAERPLGVVVAGAAMLLTYLAVGSLLGPLIPSTVRIGTDGIVITRLFRRRLIPRAVLRGVCVVGNAIEISVHSGPGECLKVSSPGEAAIVARRIEEAMAERGESAPAATTRLERGGRSIGAWLREVRAMARGAGSYREAKLDREGFCAVVEDGAAPADRRIAAAAALAGDAQGTARARIAAQACADERLRIAIEEAMEDEIEEARIEEALRTIV